jgi:hypothetical protein
MTAVTIPPELAAELRDHRPEVAIGAEVLGALPNGKGIAGRVVSLGDGGDPQWIEVDHGGGSRALSAWLLVGSVGVDDDHPVKVGDRVLALCHDGRCDVRNPCVVVDGPKPMFDQVAYPHDPAAPLVLDANNCLRRIDRWALLPDAAEPDGWLTREHECTPDRVCRVCGGPGRPAAAPGHPGLSLDELRTVTEHASATLAAEAATELCGSTFALIMRGDGESHRGELACTFPAGHPPIVDADGTAWGHGVRDGQARWTDRADLRDATIPPGRWRQGGHAKRNLWVGPPRPHGVDVGRMDTPELAAYVVDAVNRVDEAARLALKWCAERDEARERHEQLVESLCRLIPEEDGDDVAVEAVIIRWVTAKVAEVERLRVALQRIADLDDEQRIVGPDIASGALAGDS